MGFAQSAAAQLVLFVVQGAYSQDRSFEMHLKSHFLTCNFLMCLLHFGLVRSDFLMGLLHFCFLFFWGCPDGLQERFSVILVALWEPLGRSLGVLGVP